MICALEERIRLLQVAGAVRVLVLPFTRDVARLSPEEFVSQILADALETKAVFVGDNFRFGHKQAGTPDTLQALGEQFGFVSQIVKPISYRGEIVSSSAVRAYLGNGNVVARRPAPRPLFFARRAGCIRPRRRFEADCPHSQLAASSRPIVPRGVYVTETLEPRTASPLAIHH